MRRFTAFLVIMSLSASMLSCGNSNSKTPVFDDNDILQISGKYLTDASTPLSDASIQLQNVRRFGFIDQTAVAIETALFLVFLPLWILPWPFFPFPKKFGDISKFREKPNYYLDSIRTNSIGEFSFNVRAGDLYRDGAGGINIVLNNEQLENNKFGKYSFVIKNKDSDLGTLPLCDLGGITYTENASSITFNWSAAPATVVRYLFTVFTRDDQAMLWAESVAGTATTLTLAKTVFGDQSVSATIEAFYTDDDDKKISCLTPSKDITIATPVVSKAKDAVAMAEGIKFDVTSLTNGSLSDSPYFKAFNTKSITLDLGAATSLSYIVMHNLKLESAGTMTISTSSNGATFTTQGTPTEARFMRFDFPAAVSARYIKLDFNAAIFDLQEISVF